MDGEVWRSLVPEACRRYPHSTPTIVSLKYLLWIVSGFMSCHFAHMLPYLLGNLTYPTIFYFVGTQSLLLLHAVLFIISLHLFFLKKIDQPRRKYLSLYYATHPDSPRWGTNLVIWVYIHTLNQLSLINLSCLLVRALCYFHNVLKSSVVFVECKCAWKCGVKISFVNWSPKMNHA